jgi:hypothetical protein
LKKYQVGTGAVLLLSAIVVSSYFSPHFALHQMTKAIDKRDADAFSEHVDFPALRENFKGQIMIMVGKQMDSPDMQDNPFAGFGQILATAVIGPMVDAMISPAGVMAMINQGSPKVTPGSLMAGSVTPAAAGPDEGRPNYSVAYASWSRVRVTARTAAEPKGNFVFKRQGFWSWKLAGVEFPGSVPAGK